MREFGCTRGRTDCEEGFTLVELMVVLLILGILIAITFPVFVGAQDRARNRETQSDLRNGVATATAVYVELTDYAAVPAATLVQMLNDDEPALDFIAAATASSGSNNYAISTRVFQYPAITDPDYSELNLAVRSATGDCFYLRQIPEASAVGDRPGDWRGYRPASAMPACSGNAVAGFATNATNFNGWT